MKVKCPKCRLRFEIPTEPGITEVKCFCPRCGTPFNFTLSEEESEENEAIDENIDSIEPNADNKIEAAPNKEVDTEKASKAQTSTDIQAEQTHNDIHSDENAQKFIQDHLLDVRGPIVLRDKYNHSHRHVFMFILGIITMICLVAFFAKGLDLAIGHFADKDQANSQSLAVDSVVRAYDQAKAEANTRNKWISRNRENKSGTRGSEESGEALPHWLQGKWYLQTKEDDIVMNIRGNSIAVSDDNHTNIGTAYRKKNILICKFLDGRTFCYGLDLKRHKIILDHRRAMTKDR